MAARRIGDAASGRFGDLDGVCGLVEPLANSCRAAGPVQLAISLVERIGPGRLEMISIRELDGDEPGSKTR